MQITTKIKSFIEDYLEKSSVLNMCCDLFHLLRGPVLRTSQDDVCCQNPRALQVLSPEKDLIMSNIPRRERKEYI